MTPTDTPKASKARAKAAHYVDNKRFLAELTEYRDAVQASKLAGEDLKPQVTEYLGDCLIKIATHLAYKSNFINYSFRDEMVSDAIENCLAYIDNFDPAKSKNPFAYFTQISYFAFVRRIQKEKKVQMTKNKYIESLDLSEIITQEHDAGDYGNGFISFLKKQVDQAQKELYAPAPEAPANMKRRPMYLSKKKAEVVANSEVLPIEEDNRTTV